MDSFFLFKRVVGIVMQPLALVYILLFLALALFALTRLKRTAWFFLACSLAVLVLASVPLLTRALGRTLESASEPFLALEPSRLSPAAIVVLGNGVAHPGDAAMPALTRLNDTARARLVEGVRLAGLFPEANLVVSGNGLGLENCADAMAGAAAELGVEPRRITRLTESMDTDHEARLVKALVGEGQVILVTSAVHMRRALMKFQENRVTTIPAPCDFIAPVTDRVLSDVNYRYWRPRGKNISDSEEIWHEYMGLAYEHWFKDGN